MRATDIVRQVLDLLDTVEDSDKHHHEHPACDTTGSETGEPIAGRFKQIFAMLDAPSTGPLANSPNEVVADIDAVTTGAGGGVNGPKHVDDIRTAHPRQFGNN